MNGKPAALDTHHTFSFADYEAPSQMGFRALRVINDDTAQPSQGFGSHGHRDMEIISYVLEGALSHRDSMGTVATPAGTRGSMWPATSGYVPCSEAVGTSTRNELGLASTK